jgi:hypothetical protein
MKTMWTELSDGQQRLGVIYDGRRPVTGLGKEHTRRMDGSVSLCTILRLGFLSLHSALDQDR